MAFTEKVISDTNGVLKYIKLTEIMDNQLNVVATDEFVDERTTSLQNIYEGKDSRVTPGFRKLQKKSQLPANKYSLFKMNYGSYQGYFLDKRYVNSLQGTVTEIWAGADSASGRLPAYPVYDFLLPGLGGEDATQLDNAALADFLDKIKNSQINVAQAFAESKKTIDMITSNLLKLVSAYRHLRKGDIFGAGHALAFRPSRKTRRNYRKQSGKDAAASAWLEMQYGWKPLMMDIRGAISEFESGILDQQIIRVSARKQRVFESNRETDPLGQLQLIHSYKRKCTYSVKYTCLYKVQFAMSALSARLGLQNPALLAWELVPFSFVVDWVLPVGDFLGQLDAVTGLVLVNGSRTEVTESTLEVEFKPNPAYAGDWKTTPGFIHQEGTMKSKSSLVRIERTPFTSFPPPPLPALKNPFSVGHALNAVALVQTVFAGGRR